MNKRQIRQIVSELTEDLTGKEFLSRTGFTKRKALTLAGREYWERCISELFPLKRRLSCAEICGFCRPALDTLIPEPEEGWMKFTYQYVSHVLYPDSDFEREAAPYAAGALFYLTVLRFFFDLERESAAFDPLVDFGFLEDEEAGSFESAIEYKRFKKTFRLEFIYEMMRLNAEVTPFRTLEHIAGVHYVAMTVARGLYEAGVPVDLALTSAAAAGHDLGKFGCKPNERVPYLHYYYTNQWFLRHDMEYTGHIAANHSTWDLEPENLSVEALLLIYADFRVKQSRGEDGRELTHISDLAGAFQVILSKLDNVDEKKLTRYRFVYARLRDFEDYMISRGIDVTLSGFKRQPETMPDIALRDTEQTVKSLVYMGIEHNIDIMHRMAAERQFGNLLEAARSEKSWKNVRAYLNIFREYFTYTNDKQKMQALGFLYELLMHREGDIRTQAAELIGIIIARFNAGYRKERPANMPDVAAELVLETWSTYLSLIIRPDHKLTEQHKNRIRYNLKMVLAAITEHAEASDLEQFLSAFLSWYEKPEGLEEEEAFALLDAIHQMPFELCRADLSRVVSFCVYYGSSAGENVRIAAWRAFKLLAAFAPDSPCCGGIRACVEQQAEDESITMTFLKYRILNSLGCDTRPQQKLLYEQDVVSDIFLDNLKSLTPWVIKAVNIKLLVDQIQHEKREHILHIAAHFSNLIKVSEHVVVRHDAGNALLRIVPLLTADQRNEIAVELMKGLEVGEYEVSKYIPEYLGRLALWLPPAQLDELLLFLEGLMASPNERIVSVTLDTVGILLEGYPEYQARFAEGTAYQDRRYRLLGMLLKGLSNYREAVRQEALLVIGQTVFASRRLGRRDKAQIFILCHKKLLFLMHESRGDELTAFYRAAALSDICRFITEYRLTEGDFQVRRRDKVAFFPGTFDPFTLSHKGIVRAIRDMGFEVYLAVDEFSWSKKTQPRLIRRQIVNMSVADEFHVNIFPDDFPVNIANPSDLKRLKEVFKDKKIYVVMGSDVIANASSYKKAPSSDSIHTMNHIAFRRVGDRSSDNKYNRAMMDTITGEVIELELPAHLEDISSSRIRENIDQNRDISNLIDPSVQEYIYYNSLYLREPEYKPILRAKAIAFEEFYQQGDKILQLRNVMDHSRPVGFARFRYIAPEHLFEALQNADLADRVRRSTSGEVLLITGIYTRQEAVIQEPEQLILAETLVRSLENRCSYAVFLPDGGKCSEQVLAAVKRQGFVSAASAGEEQPLYIVDMHEPLVLIQNLETTLKEPFSSNARVLKSIYRAHRELQTVMTRFYPGQLVLSLSATVIYHRLVARITKLNGVPDEQSTPARLGEYMCVPFGKILRGKVVPNTVTKTLHTDKVYEPDLSRDAIEAFPYYSPLKSQIKTIKSFDRPVILVDDLLHRGGRFEALEPMLKEEQVVIKKVLLGLMSGFGRDTMAIKGVEADSIYFIPNLKYWFVESTLYPFVGGDTIRRDTAQAAGLTPSVNMILPYSVPLVKGCSREVLFEFSACCIRNSRNILLTLEAEYRALFARNLTLSRLSEAVILPLCPDKGACVSYDPNLAASVYLENDLQMLYRMEKIVGKE